MKKGILLFIGLLVVGFSFLKAQTSISIYLPNNPDSSINGGHIYVNGSANSTITQYLDFKQTSPNSMGIKAESIVQSNVTSGTASYFCDWNQCYGPVSCASGVVFRSPVTLQAASDSLYSVFYADYLPSGNEGTTTIRYVFYNVNASVGSGDSAYVDVTYGTWPMGIKNMSNSNRIKMYPNPASSVLHINFETKSNVNKTIKIYDIIGNLIYSSPVRDSKVTMNVSKLNSGVYFVKFINNNKVVSTEKLFVKK